MNLLPSDQVLDDARNLAYDYQNKLAMLQYNIGKLDDIIETPYIDNRLERGAYQCLEHAMEQLENYIHEIRVQLGEIGNE